LEQHIINSLLLASPRIATASSCNAGELVNLYGADCCLLPPTAATRAAAARRDGRHFGDILNYLRTQQLAYPHDGTDFK
jgi:hypothetical protein